MDPRQAAVDRLRREGSPVVRVSLSPSVLPVQPFHSDLLSHGRIPFAGSPLSCVLWRDAWEIGLSCFDEGSLESKNMGDKRSATVKRKRVQCINVATGRYLEQYSIEAGHRNSLQCNVTAGKRENESEENLICS